MATKNGKPAPGLRVRLAGVRERWTRGTTVMVLAAVVWTVVAVVYVVRLDGRSVDDLFITYRYAQNLVHGHGFVFNPGERVFGTTAPGMGLLLALLHLLTRLPIHFLGTATTGLALVVVAVLLLAEGQKRNRMPEALAAGSWLVICNYLWHNHGSEIPVATALLLGAAALSRRWPVSAGLVAGLAVWCRPESALGVGLLALLSWLGGRRLPWRFAIAAAAVVGVGLAAAWLWFGEPLPHTLAAKQTQGISQLAMWQSGWGFWSQGVKHLALRYAGDWAAYFVAIGLIGLGFVLWSRGRVAALLVLYAVGLLVAYPLLGVSFAGWYVIPVVVALVYGVCYLAGGLVRLGWRWIAGRSAGWGRKVLAGVVVAVVVGLMLYPLAMELGPRTQRGFRHFKVYSLRHRTYQEAGLWIKEHSQASDDVAYVEVGTVAYWSERPIRDLMGLVTPESLPYVERGDMVGAFLVKPATFVIYHNKLHRLMDPVRRHRWFRRHYREVKRFTTPRGGEELIIYRRLGGSASRPP